MKHVRRHIEKNQSGSVTLVLEHDEDMWHAYNLIAVGDEVRAPAVRKIVTETNSGTGSKESHRVRLNLTIEVKKVIYSGADITSNEDGGDGSGGGIMPSLNNNSSTQSGEATLHLSGPISQQNEHVKLGAYHTLDLEPGRQFTIIKGPEGWNHVNMQRIREATDAGRGAEVGAILCDDTGKATICLISPHTTLIKKRIEVSIPKKKKPGQGTDKAADKYYKQIFEAVTRFFNFTELKLVIIASPGVTKDLVYDWIIAEATRSGKKDIITSKSKFQRVNSPSVHIQSLNEVLSSPQVANQLKDSQYTKEIQALDKFQKMLVSDEHRAWYGEGHVDKAAERGAIGTLLISDTLFRHSDPIKRRKFISLTKDVQQFGGQVLVFSSMHTSGAKLNELTGVAAILTYPLDMDIIEAEEKDS